MRQQNHTAMPLSFAALSLISVRLRVSPASITHCLCISIGRLSGLFGAHDLNGVQGERRRGGRMREKRRAERPNRDQTQKVGEQAIGLSSHRYSLLQYVFIMYRCRFIVLRVVVFALRRNSSPHCERPHSDYSTPLHLPHSAANSHLTHLSPIVLYS